MLNWEFLLFSLFVLGLAVGSFLNMLIYRLHTEEDIVTKRSHCPHCNHALGVVDLIPVVGFLLLRGRCRYCNKKISWQYPLIELLTGSLFAVFAYRLIPQQVEYLTSEHLWKLVFYLIMTCVLIVVFVYDLKHYLILNAVTYPAIVVALLFDVFLFHVTLRNLGLGLLLGAGFFLVLVVVSRERWMGWGDVKLGVLIALIKPWPSILTVFVLSYMLGAVVALIMILLKRKSTKDVLPFGTFLAAATIAVMVLEVYRIDLAVRYLDDYVR